MSYSVSHPTNPNLHAPSTGPGLVFLDLDEMDAILPWWEDCYTRCGNPFLNPHWIRSKVQHWLNERARFALYYNESGELDCLFPLRFTNREIDLIGSGICDFQDLVAPPETDIRPAVDALVAWAIGNNFFIRFRKLSTGGRLYPVFAEARWDEAYCIERPLHGPCPYFRPLADNITGITQHFSKSTRKKVRRRLRILTEDSDPVLKSATVYDARTIEKIAEIHLARHGDDSLFTFPGFRGFLKSVMQKAPGLIRCYTLESEKHGFMGFEIGVVKDDTYYSWMGGYDAALADYSIGTCLMALIMEHLGSEDFTTYDFLCGGEIYKFHFSSDEYKVHSVTIRPRRLDHLARMKLQLAKRKVAPAVKHCLNRVGLYQTNYRIDAD